MQEQNSTRKKREGPIPSYITLRSELNEAEQANILGGRRVGLSARKRRLLDEKALNNLHKRRTAMSGVGQATAPAARTSALMPTASRGK